MSYTVVAVYEDNFQVFVDHVQAKRATDAAEDLKKLKKKEGHPVLVLCVFEGQLYDLHGEDELMDAFH